MFSMGCARCHKFDNKAFCYSYCSNSVSHRFLIGEDFTKFDASIKVLRVNYSSGRVLSTSCSSKFL